MKAMLNDPSTIGLIFLLLICIYGFGLFWWYWNRKGKATEAYVYMMSIYGCGAIVMGFGVYARYISNIDHDVYHEFINSDIWALRLIPLIICFFVITFRLTIKACKSAKYEKRFYDRREGGDEKE